MILRSFKNSNLNWFVLFLESLQRIHVKLIDWIYFAIALEKVVDRATIEILHIH